jgi:hypothetical protein
MAKWAGEAGFESSTNTAQVAGLLERERFRGASRKKQVLRCAQNDNAPGGGFTTETQRRIEEF